MTRWYSLSVVQEGWVKDVICYYQFELFSIQSYWHYVRMQSERNYLAFYQYIEFTSSDTSTNLWMGLGHLDSGGGRVTATDFAPVYSGSSRYRSIWIRKDAYTTMGLPQIVVKQSFHLPTLRTLGSVATFPKWASINRRVALGLWNWWAVFRTGLFHSFLLKGVTKVLKVDHRRSEDYLKYTTHKSKEYFECNEYKRFPAPVVSDTYFNALQSLKEEGKYLYT